MAVFRYFPVKDKRPLVKNFREVATNDQEQIAIWTEQFKGIANGWGLLCGPETGLLALDVDKKTGGLETIQSLPIPDTLSQRTQSGGLHYIFKYPQDGRRYANATGFKPGLDIRGDGGFVVVYGFDNKPIVDAPDWLLNATKKQVFKVPDGQVAHVDPKIAEREYEALLEEIRHASPGEANVTLNASSYKAGQLIRANGYSREAFEAVLLEAALFRNIPKREAQNTIKSGIDGGMSKPIVSPFGEPPPMPPEASSIPPVPERVKWTPEPLKLSDLLNVSKLRKPQLFKDWSTEDITITTADGGTGKTTLKLFEAIHLALGERFLGFDCKQRGKTLFIAGEDTVEKLSAMLGKIMKEMGLFDESPGNPEKVQLILDSIRIKKDVDLCLVSKDRATGFLTINTDAVRKLEEAVQEFGPKMVVLDPISSFWGSEAALNDMNKIVTKYASYFVEKYEVCFEMINHMGKSSSQSKDMTQFAGRGGSGLPSNSRVSRVLRPIEKDELEGLIDYDLEPNESAIMVQVNKFSDGSPLYNKPFLLIRQGYLFRRETLSKGAQAELKNTLDIDERIFSYIKEERLKGKFPTRAAVDHRFTNCLESIPIAKIGRVLGNLIYEGFLGEKLRLVENPDASQTEKVYVIVGEDGREI